MYASGGRALAVAVALLSCWTAEGGVDDPCEYTVDGFVRSRSPCGLNGTCTKSTAKSTVAPHQWAYTCVCDEGYAGEKCSKCDHGYTWLSGCREMRRHSEGTGYLKVFAGSGMAMMTTSIIAMVFIFLKVLTSDPGMPMDHAEALVAMGMKHAKQTGDSHNFTDNQDRRRGRRTGVAVAMISPQPVGKDLNALADPTFEVDPAGKQPSPPASTVSPGTFETDGKPAAEP